MQQSTVTQRVRLDKVTFLDLVVIGVILLLSVGFLISAGLDREASGALAAAVYHEGRLDRRVALDKDGEIVLLDGKMRLEVRRGRVRVKLSECPRQVCVRTGWIQYAGQTIVCVPFKTLIQIDSARKAVVDAVVF